MEKDWLVDLLTGGGSVGMAVACLIFLWREYTKRLDGQIKTLNNGFTEKLTKIEEENAEIKAKLSEIKLILEQKLRE